MKKDVRLGPFDLKPMVEHILKLRFPGSELFKRCRIRVFDY